MRPAQPSFLMGDKIGERASSRIMDAMDVTVVALLSPWGSGSSAVAGFLDKCGAYTCPPHVHTADSRTPNSFEPLGLRQMLVAAFDEKTLKPKGAGADFAPDFEDWLNDEIAAAADDGASTLVIIHALLSMVLPALQEIASPRYVVITRPFDDIEATRQRRNWPATFGELGARIIYKRSHDFLEQEGLPYIDLPYPQFRSEIGVRGELLRYLSLSPSAEQLEEAEAFLR